MTTRLLLATTAAVLVAAPAAHAQMTVTGGAAIFTLPPMTGFAYTTVTENHGLGLAISAPDFGIVPVFSVSIDAPVGGRFGLFGAGFHAAATSTLADPSLLAGGGALGLVAPFPGYGYVMATAYYGDPASAETNAQTGFDLDGGIFGVAYADGVADFGGCQDPGNGCDFAATAAGTGAGNAFAYTTLVSSEGVLVAAAGIFPEGAIGLTETAGFRYFGGQGGLSAAIGNGGATVYAGAIFRALDQHHTTVLDVAFDVPVEGGTLSVAQGVTTAEDLVSRYYGATFGISVDRDVSNWLTAGLDIGFAPLFVRTQHTASQSSSLAVTGPDFLIEAGTDIVLVQEITRGAALLSIGGDVGFRFGNAARLTFGGFFEFLSAAPFAAQYYVPGISTQGTPVGGYVNEEGAMTYLGGANPNNLGTQPVAIFFNPLMTYGASVTLSIGLGGR
ncbi:MAG: hypothetical protein KIT43_00135 [Bauldia sp.]|nr:hypothetical protein [Bauldia sp.]